jgi:hypothetical protein
MTSTKTGQKNSLVMLAIAAFILLAVLLLTPFRAGADNVVSGFSSKDALQPGLVVAVDKSQSNSVKAAPANNPTLMYGIVVDPSDAPITLVGQNSKTFVATTGTYPVLASVVNGKIKSGDYISMSGIDGIAAKAIPSQPLILGKAAGSFDGSANVITTNNNKAIGRVFVSIGVQKNPLSIIDPTLPSFLRKIADGLANKSVPVIRVYTAMLIFLISILASLTILWSGVRSSLISLGRNPLSRKSIFSGMYKTIFTGLGVFIIGMAGVYLLVKV